MTNSRLHHWLEQEETENDRERESLEVERARASYMVAKVGQQENGNRAYTASGTSHQHCAITRGHQLGLQSLQN
jgi:hypothetical protein